MKKNNRIKRVVGQSAIEIKKELKDPYPSKPTIDYYKKALENGRKYKS